MRRPWAFVLVLLAAPALAGAAKISGTVVDQNGSPVPNVRLEFWPLDMAWSGGFPLARTDERGHFVKQVDDPYTWNGRSYGRWAVYPYQEEAYYPRMTSFYTTDKARSVHVDLTADGPEVLVEIKLGPKAGAITGRVTDSVTGETLDPEFDLAWASGEPSKRMGIRMREPYRILLPANTEGLSKTCTWTSSWSRNRPCTCLGRIPRPHLGRAPGCRGSLLATKSKTRNLHCRLRALSGVLLKSS